MKKFYGFLLAACVFALMTPVNAVTLPQVPNGKDTISASTDKVITAQADKCIKVAAKKATTKGRR